MVTENFEFSGEWTFDHPLPFLSKLHDKHWYSKPEESVQYHKLNAGVVTVQIVDRRDNNPDPMECQWATLNYIIQNERSIHIALFNSVKEIINPKHIEYSGGDWIKPLNGVNDLGKTIKIDQIQIQLEEKNGLSYYAIMCEYIGDYEHGIVITMYKDEYIGSEGSWEVDYEGIANHRGGFTEAERDANIALNEAGEGVLHLPHEKYGKLKPWQVDANGNFLSKMIKDSKNNELIIKYVEEGKLDINIPISSYWGDGLVGLADYFKNNDLLNYFFDKGAPMGRLFFRYTDNQFDRSKLDFFISKGADVDAFNFYGQSVLFDAISKYCSAHIRTFRVRDETKVNELRERLEQKKVEIQYYLSKGANPKKCNRKGQDYRSILTESWGSYKDDYNSIDEVDLIIYGSIQQNHKAEKKSRLDWIKNIFRRKK